MERSGTMNDAVRRFSDESIREAEGWVACHTAELRTASECRARYAYLVDPSAGASPPVAAKDEPT